MVILKEEKYIKWASWFLRGQLKEEKDDTIRLMGQNNLKKIKWRIHLKHKKIERIE